MKALILAVGALLACAAASAQEPEPPAGEAGFQLDLTDPLQYQSYLIGLGIGDRVSDNHRYYGKWFIDIERFQSTLRAVTAGEMPIGTVYADVYPPSYFSEVYPLMRVRSRILDQQEFETRREAAAAYYAARRELPGTIELPSGVLVRTLTQGSGAPAGPRGKAILTLNPLEMDGSISFLSNYRQATDVDLTNRPSNPLTEAIVMLQPGTEAEITMPPPERPDDRGAFHAAGEVQTYRVTIYQTVRGEPGETP